MITAEDHGIILGYFDSGVVVVGVGGGGGGGGGVGGGGGGGLVTSKAKQTLSVLPGYSCHYIH